MSGLHYVKRTCIRYMFSKHEYSKSHTLNILKVKDAVKPSIYISKRNTAGQSGQILSFDMQARNTFKTKSYLYTPGTQNKLYCTMPERIREYAQRTPDKEALIFVGENSRIGVTYSNIANEAEKIARKLSSFGIRQGETVAIQEDKSPMWILSTVAVQLCGAWPLHFTFERTDGSDAVSTLAASKCSTIITPPGDDDMYVKIMKNFIVFGGSDGKVTSKDVTTLNQVIFTCKPVELENVLTVDSISHSTQNVTLSEPEPEDTAAIFCTSGSSGTPKLVSRNHTSLISVSYHLLNLMDYRKEESCYCGRPFGWAGGYPYDILHGRTRVVPSSVFKEGTIREESENIMRIVKKENCQHTVLFTSTVHDIVQNEPTIHKLKSVVTDGMPISSETVSEGSKLCQKFVNRYGLTELGLMTVNVVRDNQTTCIEDYDVGVPIPGVEVKVVRTNGRLCDVGEMGEIFVRTLMGTTGYLQEEQTWHKEARTEGYWFKTGDAGYISSNWHLHVTGRIAESIVTNGKKLSPSLFEDIYKRNPMIENVVVFAIPDKIAFNIPGVAVVLKEAGSQTEEQLLSFYRNESKIYFKDTIHAARYEPKRIIFFDKFPVLSNGKIARSVVKNMALDRIL